MRATECSVGANGLGETLESLLLLMIASLLEVAETRSLQGVESPQKAPQWTMTDRYRIRNDSAVIRGLSVQAVTAC